MIDDRLRRLCVTLSACAYDAAPDYRWGDVTAIAERHGGVICIAFTGTRVDFTASDWRACLDNILRDLDAWPERDPELGWCHAGFLDGAHKIAHTLAREVKGTPYVLTGHSLGGALALTAGALLTAQGLPPRAIVTFGAPRCGFLKMRRVLRREAVEENRFGIDVVPTVPWALPLIPYLPMRRRRRWGPSLGDELADHHVENYSCVITSV